MVFGNGVKNIQAAAYNGARTVYNTRNIHKKYKKFMKFMNYKLPRQPIPAQMSNHFLYLTEQIILIDFVIMSTY